VEGRVMGDSATERDRSIHNERGAQIVFGSAPWLVILALVLGLLGFTFGVMALINSSKVADFAFIAGEAKSKAETATARANVSEIYSKQLFTEMNRLGYPIRTPAEEHAPQPSGNVSEEPGK
jgi:hypothetical protein